MTDDKHGPARPVIFGEVLFDRFPDGIDVLGGAPFNVAWHLQGFGAAPLFISRVGDDEPGRRVHRAMREWGMDTAGLQVDSDYPTGTVQVSLMDGQPTFDILPEQAYDRVEADGAERAVAAVRSALIYHGTLIMRDQTSRGALERLCARADAPVFVDVNLRDPWWRESDLPVVLARARWVKVNEDELARVASRLGRKAGVLDELARWFQQRFDIALLLVTCGADGAVAFGAPEGVASVKPPGNVAVVDTVGAGDAFASVLLLGIIRGWPLSSTMERAQGFASRICSQRGATAADPGLYRDVMRSWGL